MIVLYLLVVFIVVILNVLAPSVMYRKEINTQVIKRNPPVVTVDNKQFSVENTMSGLKIYKLMTSADGTVSKQQCRGYEFYDTTSDCTKVFFQLLTSANSMD